MWTWGFPSEQTDSHGWKHYLPAKLSMRTAMVNVLLLLCHRLFQFASQTGRRSYKGRSWFTWVVFALKYFICLSLSLLIFELILKNWNLLSIRRNILVFGKGPHTLADPGGCHWRAPPGSKFFHIHAVSGKNLKKIAFLGVGAPPWENPGSATAKDWDFSEMVQNFQWINTGIQ